MDLKKKLFIIVNVICILACTILAALFIYARVGAYISMKQLYPNDFTNHQLYLKEALVTVDLFLGLIPILICLANISVASAFGKVKKKFVTIFIILAFPVIMCYINISILVGYAKMATVIASVIFSVAVALFSVIACICLLKPKKVQKQ